VQVGKLAAFLEWKKATEDLQADGKLCVCVDDEQVVIILLGCEGQ